LKLTHAKPISETRLRKWRRLVTVFVLFIYFLTGALHRIADFDAMNASGMTVVALMNSSDHAGPSEEGAVAGHHCHGCFSLSVPGPFNVAMLLQSKRQFIMARDVMRRDSATEIDPPPPKYLT
jgi:hypothetical protein